MANTAAPPELINREAFRWRLAETGPEVFLRWFVMAGIDAEVLEGFKALPRRGAEVGGVLLGHRGPAGEFFIDSWRPIAIEHRSGPSYVLSDSDISAWSETVKQARAGTPKFIGIYRSQTRPGLAVTPEDCAIVEKFLPRDEGVLLIVKPLSVSESVATFCLCEGGAVVDAASESREFAFGRTVIPAGALIDPEPRDGQNESRDSEGEPVRQRSIATPDISARDAATRSASTAVAPAARRISWIIPASAIMVGGALGMFVHYRGGIEREIPVPASLAAPAQAGALDLRTERSGTQLELEWNSRSPVIQNSTGAVLTIEQRGSRFERTLTAEELRAGSLVWRPAPGETKFDMRVFDTTGRAYAESVRVLRPQR